jgi:hypothetical protein
MGYHLIPFVAGAVIGGLAVHLFRDERVREDLRRSAGTISRKVQQTAGKVSKGVTRVRESMPGGSAATEPDAEGDAAAPEAAEAKPRSTTRRRAARQLLSRKKPTTPEKARRTGAEA